MKLRKPKTEQPPEIGKRSGIPRWKTFHFRLLTPIFGGGVTAGEPDREMPVRAASVRGQLRFWWRLLQQETGEALFLKERALWGAMAEDGRDFASQVRVRVRNVTPGEKLDIQPCFINNRPDAATAEYAYFPGRETKNESGKIETPALNIIKGDLKFDLELRCQNEKDQWPQVEKALRWWATFGGLGARTRRGSGAVRCDQLDPISRDDAIQAGCFLCIRDFDVYSSPVFAWKKAVSRLKDFRQKELVGRNKGRWKKNQRTGKEYYTPGTSMWPEADSIRRIIEQDDPDKKFTRHRPVHRAMISFPRAAFGLPIIFHFKGGGRDEPEDTILSPSGTGRTRMASPLILTAYPLDNGKYAPAALRLPHHLGNLSLELAYNKKGGEILRQCISDLNPNQVDVPPMNGRGENALKAFMTFFDEEEGK